MSGLVGPQGNATTFCDITCGLQAMPTSTVVEFNCLSEFSRGTLRSLLFYSHASFFVGIPNKQEVPGVAVKSLMV